MVLALLAAATTSRGAQAEMANTEKNASTSTPVESQSDRVANSVVKVFCTARYPDVYKPWTKQAPIELSGSGVVIDGNRILTCAHVVTYASEVQVQANQAGDKISATVEAIGPGIDLAVLKVDDPNFFKTHKPLARAKALPQVSDAVMVYGYPRGGISQSITKGIVSRIEFAIYNYPVGGLRIQVDAAINPGNSGGPAVAGDKMIGIAYSLLGGAQNIGYIIPNEEIDTFLRDIADGHYDGKLGLYDEFQLLGNPALRTYLKLDPAVQGVVVHKPDSTDPAYPLKEWDVITHIGDAPIDDQGNIKLGDNLRVFFKYLVSKAARNGKVPLTVVRAGKEMHVEVPVSKTRPRLISSLNGRYPSYFVYGPVVFSTATTEYLEGFARGEYAATKMALLTTLGSPLVQRAVDKQAFEGERLVVVSSPFFPHRLTKDYGSAASRAVSKVNGIPVKNLEHLVQILRDCKDQYVVFEFYGVAADTLVFPRAEMVAATDEILTDNDLRSQGSPDTLAIWNAKP